MKKIVTTLLFLAVLAVGVSSAQELAKDKSLANWSFGVKGGIDYFRVEPYASASDNYWWKGKLSHYALQASWAAPFVFVDYTVNHWFGVGLELGWLHYNRSLSAPQAISGNPNIIAPEGTYLGNTADAVLYGSINITNLVAPYRKGGWRVISLYANGGFGGAWYRYKTPTTNGEFSNHLSFLGMVSLTTAFNVSKVWELFMEGQYRVYTREDLGGFPAPGRSVDALTFLVGVRWKLGGKKASNGGHSRNALLEDNGAQLLEEARAARRAAEEGIAAVNQRVDGLEDRVKDLEDATPKATKKDLDDAVRNLQRQINELRSGQATTGTTSFRDIRFRTGSDQFTPESIKTLDEIFNVLNNDAWTTLEIFGYTDNVGGVAFNQRLSERRANAVKNYLVKKGLDAAKIKATGRGIRNGNSTAEGRAENRRVDFTISK